MLEKKLKVFQKDRNTNTPSLQEQLLQEALRRRKVITLILLKGLHVKGVIQGYDAFSVLIESDEKQQLVYKHAISTIRF